MTRTQVLKVLAKAVEEAGSANRFAEQHDFSAAFISMVSCGVKAPSTRLLTALGLRKHVTYTKAD